VTARRPREVAPDDLRARFERKKVEAPVYVARTGPEALRAMRAVNDLEGRTGLARLAETWWRL